MILGSDSVVYEECEIECPSLPHGTIDIVAGHIHQGGDMQDVVKLNIGVTAKTPQKLLTNALGEYTC